MGQLTALLSFIIGEGIYFRMEKTHTTYAEFLELVCGLLFAKRASLFAEDFPDAAFQGIPSLEIFHLYTAESYAILQTKHNRF